MAKSDNQLIDDLKNLDSGYCNPIKIKMADQDEQDIRQELKDRGWTNQEIDEKLSD